MSLSRPAPWSGAPWESGLLIVDKPGGMTSHDVVARIRRLARTRRVGHAGTLDPMATGVLVIGIEKATRLLGHLMLTEKTYEATIRLGQSTTTDDAEGEPTGAALRPASGVTRAALDAEIAKLTGDILQVPSSVSAIKVNGQRAYKLTRAGEAPELAARPVTVYVFNVTATRLTRDYLDVDATIRCSSGTYVRALARDLGAALGTGGHLTALRRTAVGPYTVAAAHTLEALENQNSSPERLPLTPTALPGDVSGASPSGVPEDFPGFLPSAAQGQAAETDWPTVLSTPVIPLAAAAAAAFPSVDLSFDDARRLAQGARLPIPPGHPAEGGAPHDVPLAAFDPDGTLIALVTTEGDRLRSLAVFVDAAANPPGRLGPSTAALSAAFHAGRATPPPTRSPEPVLPRRHSNISDHKQPPEHDSPRSDSNVSDHKQPKARPSTATEKRFAAWPSHTDPHRPCGHTRDLG